jgi:hypothetical protein
MPARSITASTSNHPPSCKRLTPLIRNTQPYTKRIAHKGIWVEPELLAEIEYRAKSGKGKVRHPFFRGLREDLWMDDFDRFWEWANKPLDSGLTIPADIHHAVTSLPPEARRDRAKDNEALRMVQETAGENSALRRP